MLNKILATNVRGELVSTDIDEARVLASVQRILDESELCSISTVTPDNRAHINIAYVAHTCDLRFCFLSHPSARHCLNLESNPSMAISVFNSAQKWGGPDRGLQLFGSSRIANAFDDVSAAQLYGKRFSQYQKWAANLSEDTAGREYRLYWFFAEQFKVSDEQEFGDGVFVSAVVQR